AQATPPRQNTLPRLEAGSRIIGIGASTGGPQAFQTILAHLPANLAAPVICIQHISEGFAQGLVDWLSGQCRLKVQTAENGVIPQSGKVYFPLEGSHLKIDSMGRLECSQEPISSGHRPSIDIGLKSLASHYGRGAVGVLLTGMGRDGVEGMKAIAEVGGVTIAQDEESSIVFGMPKEAIAANAARYILPLPEIAPALVKLLGQDTEKAAS
ncbi:MAG: CheB methylesterase domain-containing protein, partial [Methylococcaceae bacterium]|nr:CheB methylesterase domain-containing protein [Methylococcaceae bacterium]